MKILSRAQKVNKYLETGQHIALYMYKKEGVVMYDSACSLYKPVWSICFHRYWKEITIKEIAITFKRERQNNWRVKAEI